MDALAILLLAIYLSLQVVEETKQIVKKNTAPVMQNEFRHKDENAFMKLFNAIMKGNSK